MRPLAVTASARPSTVASSSSTQRAGGGLDDARSRTGRTTMRDEPAERQPAQEQDDWNEGDKQKQLHIDHPCGKSWAEVQAVVEKRGIKVIPRFSEFSPQESS